MSKVTLKDVRLTFPNLFEPDDFGGQGKPKFSAAFLFAKDHPAAKAVMEACKQVAKDKWGGKAADIFKSMKASDKLALHDGDAKSQYAGYEGNMFVNASNDLRPTVVDGRRQPLHPQDGKPYSGCYVNAIIEVWAQDNQYGKRINASLLGVQFLRDGERLAGSSVASEDEFDEIPDAVSEDGAGDIFGEEPLDDDIPY